MKPETIAVVAIRVFGMVTMLAGPVAFLRVPSMAKVPSTVLSGQVSSSDSTVTNYVVRQVPFEVHEQMAAGAIHHALLTAGIQMFIQIVIGAVLIGASRPLGRLICRGLSETS